MVSTSGCAKPDEVDLVGHLSPIIGVGDEEDTVAELVELRHLKGSRVEYPTGINCKFLRKESFIDAVARDGTELEAVLKELEISRFKRVASKDDKVRRSQAKRRMAAKTSGSMEEKLPTPELNIPLKLARLNEMPDEPVDMATVSRTVVQNLAKRKAAKRGDTSRSVTSDSVDDSSKRRKVTSPTKSQVVLEESDKIAKGADLRPRFEVEAGLLEEQCRANAREKMVVVMDDEFKKLEGEKNQLEEGLTQEREAFQLELEKEREAATLKLKEVRAKSVAEAERLVTAFSTSRNNHAGKLYQLRYTKAEIMAFIEGNYEEREIMDEEEVEEMEEKVASGSQHKAELAEYRIRALNEDISDMKANIRALNEQLLDHLKADLRHLKGREAQSRADLAEIQAKNKSLVDDLAHARGNVRRAVQREKETNEGINQLCARISESERELRVREMKYQKDLKFELDKRDGEITFG
ncbi:hypothetical protein GIB67_021748 [Kingdonia uniflora]|uniref:Uncharacterized protein n=1 Tax=Kingdonia uniflora TaxID=39325 RepID=A0A7J7M9P1_9MAGN|nr:hypothetical protein GIB67_021748 [Kingdonia uniflora]